MGDADKKPETDGTADGTDKQPINDPLTHDVEVPRRPFEAPETEEA